MSRKAKSTTKNGYVLIADIGPPSSKFLNQKTFAEITKDCLQNFIQQKIFLNNSTDDVAIILSGTENTENRLDYKHIQVLRNLEQVNWGASKLVDEFVRTKNWDADWMDALGVALDLIHKKVESGSVYGSIQIIFFTAFESPFKSSTKTLKAYVAALLDKKIDLFFVGSNVDKELLEHEEKLSKGELVACQLLQEAGGEFESFGDYSAKTVYCTEKPKLGMPWSITLDIGSTVKIPLSGYIKVRKCDSLKWSEEINTGEALVDKERTFQKESKMNVMVDKEDVIYAYKYGSTYIPMSNEEEKTLTYNSGSKCLSVLAFVDPIPPHLRIGPGTMFFFSHRKAGVVDRSAQIALSALIHAMEETGKVALVRRVYSSNSKATLGVLSPRIKLKYECLVFNELPFSDDWRQYEFAPIITPKTQPNREQLDAIDLLMDKLDLTAAEKRGNFGFESTQMTDPYEEYIRYVVAFKAIHPDDALPGIPSHIVMSLQASPSMMSDAKEVLDRLKHLFPLEAAKSLKVKDFEASKRSTIPATAEEEEIEAYKKRARLDESGEVDLMSILGADVVKVGTTHPIKDFSLLLEVGKKPVEGVYEEMENVIIELLKDSGGTNRALMAKAQNCLKAYREHALAENRAIHFNLWIERFKEHVVNNYFGDFWQNYVSESRLGLITMEESSVSTVDKEEAEQFLRLTTLNESLESLDEDEDLLNLI